MKSSQKRITRERQPLTCSECRPCENCIKRGDASTCTYLVKVNGAGAERGGRNQTEARLQHLEQLVYQLSGAPHRTSTLGSSVSITSSEAAAGSALQAPPNGGTTYRGSTHWSEMLAGIDQLRQAIVDEQPYAGTEDDAIDSYDILFGAVPALSYQHVLAQFLPPRQEVDRYISAYFRSKAVRAPFLHSSQFRRLYQKFWEAPSSMSPLWTSMLFSICYVSENVLVAQSATSPPSSRHSTAAAHCLVAGGYHKPRRFAVEALLLYIQVGCINCLDIPAEIGTLLGLLVRLAIRMGYHREPASNTFTPFEREMRRRTWSLAMQLDLLLSFQAGLPSTVQFPTWDTLAPANIMDADFDEDTLIMPPTRPDTTDTDILFYISKHKLMATFEKILRHALSPIESFADERGVLNALDNELRTTYDALPEALRPRPMTASVLDPPANIVTRLCVFAIYAKSLCVLHRPYVVRGHFASVQACYEAASDLIRYFCDAYATMQPGGQNESERWFLGSITWFDFLTASMALCLVVCVSCQRGLGIIDEAATFALIGNALFVCRDQANRSKDTRRVIRLLEYVLMRLESERSQGTSNSTTVSDALSTSLASEAESSNTLGDEVTFDGDWALGDVRPPPLDDPSWAFMAEFLQFPADDTMYK